MFHKGIVRHIIIICKEFFADDLHRAYCIICNRDAMAIKQRAIDIAKVIKSKGNRSFRNERQSR